MLNDWLINLEEFFVASTFLGLGISYLGGVLVSFSPCIYPLIPITLGIVGAASASTKRKGFLLSFVFILGVATVYTTLGIISSFFGVFLGNLFINPITYLVLTLIFFFLGASCFEVIRIRLPFTVSYRRWIGKGLLSLFVLGMLSGLAIIPCSFPVLGAILSLISLKGNVVYGATALFLFSLGYGTLLMILGTFSSLVRKLPKEGLWVIIIERAIGVMFGAMGIYFLLKFISLIR